VPDRALSSLDLSFLCMERPATPMHMGAVAILAPTAGVARRDVMAVLARRAAAIPRLRRTARSTWLPPGGATWVDDPGFDVARHLRSDRLPAPAGRAELAAWVGRLMAEPLDRSRPPWEIHVARLADGSAALLLKIHHALADGLGAAAIGTALVDGGLREVPPAADAGPSPAGPSPAGPSPAGPSPAGPSPSLARRMLGLLPAGGDVPQLVRGVTTAATVVRSAPRFTPGLPFDVTVGPARRFGAARVGLDDLRLVRRRHGGTVNDVLLALVTGALRTWLSGRGLVVDGIVLRAMVPVSRRRGGAEAGAQAGAQAGTEAGAGGNRLSAYRVDLPVGEADPVRRLHTIRAAMDRNKAAGPEAGPGAVAVLADLVPPAVHRVAAATAAAQASLLFDTTVTQVPIPRPMSLAGAELRELYPLPPLAPGQPVGIALSTYRDVVYVGLNADAAAVPDLDRLADGIPAALDELLAVTSPAEAVVPAWA